LRPWGARGRVMGGFIGASISKKCSEKTVEKAFKQYTSRIATLNEKIKILNEKIDYVMTADHLIEIERKIVANEEDKKSKKKKLK
jgi:hypothetical protein